MNHLYLFVKGCFNSLSLKLIIPLFFYFLFLKSLYLGVSEFLLKSERFAAIDDVIGTADLLPAMFLKAEVEITESVSYLLFSQVSNPRNTENDVWKTKANINNCDTITCVNTLRSINDQSRSTSKERSSKVAATIPAQPVCKDKNDNPISSVSLFTNSDNKQCKESTAVNGGAKPAPTLFNPKDSTVISSQVRLCSLQSFIKTFMKNISRAPDKTKLSYLSFPPRVSGRRSLFE